MSAGKRLMLECHSCHEDFDSPVQMDESSFKLNFELNNLNGMSVTCPHCGTTDNYPTNEFRFYGVRIAE